MNKRVFLTIAFAAAFLPFLNHRMLRMAGDEKVYLTQAIEMARNGRWFIQTLADEPNYFKGPMHYIFVRIGMLFFGNQLIAGTWMNAVLALLSAFAMYWFGRKRWNDKAGLLLGLATGLNVGVFSHALASQMEVELCAFYAFAIAALGLAPEKFKNNSVSFKYDVAFWVTAGMIGWIKSPVHSVLIGVGGIAYWLSIGQLWTRVRSLQAMLAVLIGVVVGIAGYLPAFIFDHQNFVSTYLGREQFNKGSNNRSWSYVVVPLLYFALPWTFVLLFGLLKLVRAKTRSAIDLSMVKLGLTIALPTILFWSTWDYKGQNYNLPTMPALLVLGWACFKGEIPRWSFRLAGGLGVLTLFAAVALITHFWPLPGWWALGWLAVAFLGILAFSATFILSGDEVVLCMGATAFFIAFGAFITPLGEREMIDVRQFVKEHPNTTYHYYNLNPSIWSEWSLLQLTLHHPIYGLHRSAQLPQAVKSGHTVLAPSASDMNTVLNFWRKNVGQKNALAPIVTPWTRWLTKGKSSDGQSHWKSAWSSRSLRELEREFYIIYFP